MAYSEKAVRAQFPILRTRVPSSRGGTNPLRFFDHAASTHAPKPVIDAVVDLAGSAYANVHRGNHHLSRKATDLFEDARETLIEFIGGSAAEDTALFAHNTTGALDLGAHMFAHLPGDVIISHLEHHSNDLPHRRNGNVHRVDPEGDVKSLPGRIEAVLRKTKIKLVAITGASNVTGECPDVHAIARVAHEHGAKILVDAAQLLAHKPLDVKPASAPDHLDLVAAAGHKTYAPFGSAMLYGPRTLMDAAPPFVPGGGTVRFVTTNEIEYLKSPDRHEAGTPNVPGAVAFAASVRWLEGIGMDNVYEHEMNLAAQLRKRFAAVPGLRTFQVGGAPDRLGVAPFLLDGWEHEALATALDDGWGIATRDGCFCAHPLVADLLGVPESERREILDDPSRERMPGLVRASLGIYNTAGEVDVLAEALETLGRRESPPKAAPLVKLQPWGGRRA